MKFRVLHLGDDIKYNHDTHRRFASEFDLIQPSVAERDRPEFIRALKEHRWGEFHAIFRPYWNTGGEMGRWDAELIALLPPSVKIMASAGAGYDWADVDVFAKRGILYCNGAASSESVADMTLFLILGVFRNLAWSHQAAHSMNPQRFLDAHKNSPLSARNPRDHKLGIIGLGQIGYTIAQKAHRALGMQILYNDLIRKSPEMEDAVGHATYFPDLDAMLAEADCVVVATPFAGRTLLTRETLGKFKRGARFINIARGSLVDEEALLWALDEGILAAVGMDVHADEPYVNPRLASCGKVMMMAHNAGGHGRYAHWV